MTCSTWADHDGQARDDARVADLVGKALFAAAGKDDLTDNFGVEGAAWCQTGLPNSAAANASFTATLAHQWGRILCHPLSVRHHLRFE